MGKIERLARTGKEEREREMGGFLSLFNPNPDENIITEPEKKITEPIAGDHNYTWRSLGYSHHGIYVGERKVIHFTAVQKRDSSSGFSISSFSTSSTTDPDAPTSSCPEEMPGCGFQKPENGVAMCCLKCFLDGGSLYRFEYGVSVAKKGRNRTTAKSDSPKEVLHRAEYLLHNGFGTYDLFINNCEDFAVYCKTGLCIRGKKGGGMSGQVASFHNATLEYLESPIIKIFGPKSWFATDIGDLTDVEKVSVEELVKYGAICPSTSAN